MKNYKKIIIIPILLLFFSSYATDIYVAKDGDDANTGTIDSPYLTIGKAASVAVAGDVVYIREGTYEETLQPTNSGGPGNPIIFQSYPGEQVIITAMEALSGWTQDSGSIYKTTVPFAGLGQENFVLNGETACDLARWPNNEDGNPFTLDSKRNSGGSDSDARQNAFLTSNEIPNIDWTGGSVFFYGDKPGAGWLAWKEFITSSSSGQVNFSVTKKQGLIWIYTVHAPADLGDFYLEGAKGALDYQNEWYFDTNTSELFIQLPGGGAPLDGVVQMRRRQTAVDLNSRSYIEVRDLAVFGGSIEMGNNSNNNVIYGISSFYGNHVLGVQDDFSAGKQSVLMTGNNNTIEKCEIGFGAATGIKVAGDGNKILNSRIHDFNYIGSYDAPINARGGMNTKMSNNTIFRGGRDGVQYFNDFSEFSYNDVSQSNLIADDCALIYTVGGPSNGEIHHNWFHDSESRGDLDKAAGIYLDNDAEAFLVHHNVVWNTEWSNIQINWNGTDIDIFNNTLWNGSKVMDAWHKDGTAFSNVKVWNNLGSDNNWEPQSDKQNNLVVDASVFDNADSGDFNLKSGSSPIDQGRVIDGITDGYTGSKPDVGAYEFGGDNWVPGIDWDYQYGPTGLGCYGIPGEDCITLPKDDLDKDGVADEFDNCPNTPIGTTVNTEGCPVFTLAADNFTILTTGEQCASSNDGSISITSAETSLDFTAKIEETSAEQSFTSAVTFDGLSADSYTICITTTADADYKQCFNVTIVEPEDLSVFSKVDSSKNQVTLNLSGSNLYRITLNNITTVTDKSEITLDLNVGDNSLLVSTDKDCQGKYQENIKLFSQIVMYPNAVRDNLTVAFPEEPEGLVNYQLVSSTGNIILQNTEKITNRKLKLNMERFSSGMYFIKITSQKIDFHSKIIKL